jgi:outer membrane protein assembly factor BamA
MKGAEVYKNWHLKLCITLLTIFVHSTTLVAQQDSVHLKRNKFSFFPVAFYSPETKLAFGVLGAYTFYNTKDTNQQYPSQIQIGAAYTFNKQVLFYFPFRIYTKKSKYTIYGEAGYYKYSYFFYGVGNNLPDENEELYKVSFPRIRFNALKKVSPTVYAGLRYWLEDYKITSTEAGKQLATGVIPGSEGSFVSGLGPVVNIDTRDNIFYPSKGVFVDAGMQVYGKATGSQFTYNRYTIDASMYLADKNKHVLALNLFGDFVSQQSVPFNHLALMGGNKRMRGYYEGRFRDKNLLAIGSEYRFKLYKRFGAAVFANAGAVNKSLIKLPQHIRTTYGAGARYALNKNEQLNIRLDAAFGKNTSGFYFTIGEAF